MNRNIKDSTHTQVSSLVNGILYVVGPVACERKCHSKYKTLSTWKQVYVCVAMHMHVYVAMQREVISIYWLTCTCRRQSPRDWLACIFGRVAASRSKCCCSELMTATSCQNFFTGQMSFALNRSSALQHFKLGNTIEKMDGIESSRTFTHSFCRQYHITQCLLYTQHTCPSMSNPPPHTPLQTSFRAT